MRRRLLVCAIVLLAAGTARAGEAVPRLLLDQGGRLVLSDLPSILGDEDIERYLGSGLTTSFVFQARPQGAMKPGAARVDIRFELWDEVYLVTLIDGTGEIETSRRDSARALYEWWSDADIVLSGPAARADVAGGSSAIMTAAVGSEVKVSLAVVPFSRAELIDTQKWLTESIGQTQGGARSGRNGGASRAVGALIATSMQRRSVRSIAWNLAIERRDQP